MNDFPRGRPLKQCPHVLCGRGDRTCRKLVFNRFCLKTHFAGREEWKREMLACVEKIERIFNCLSDPTDDETECAASVMYAFQSRMDASLVQEAENNVR
jgi:hypothetical protein